MGSGKYIWNVRTRIYAVMVPSAFGTGQGLRLMCVVNMQISAVRMDWRESDYDTTTPIPRAPFV